jgi:hypothetical protein
MMTTPGQQQRENTQEPTLLLAFELGLKTWKLGFARDFSDKPWLHEIVGSAVQVMLAGRRCPVTR